MTTVLDAWRERGFGVPVTAETLVRVGVPESLARRTLQSLVLLDLLDQDGTPTQLFKDFRSTRGDDEYRTRLQEWLRGVYADVLQYADPSTDPHDRVTEAFRTYDPAGQRRGMASLLVGLWKYAGLPVKSDDVGARAPVGRSITVGGAKRKSPTRDRRQLLVEAIKPSTTLSVDGLPPGLVGLLRQIPLNGGPWTTKRRASFLQAFQAVLDFSVPVDDSPPETEEAAEQEAEP